MATTDGSAKRLAALEARLVGAVNDINELVSEIAATRVQAELDALRRQNAEAAKLGQQAARAEDAERVAEGRNIVGAWGGEPGMPGVGAGREIPMPLRIHPATAPEGWPEDVWRAVERAGMSGTALNLLTPTKPGSGDQESGAGSSRTHLACMDFSLEDRFIRLERRLAVAERVFGPIARLEATVGGHTDGIEALTRQHGDRLMSLERDRITEGELQRLKQRVWDLENPAKAVTPERK